MRANRHFLVAMVTAWLALAALSIATGTPGPAFLNYSNRNDYGCCKPTVVGDTWLRVCGEATSIGYTLPLIYSSETSGPPISLTISALDYHKDAFDYTHMDVESVVVAVGDNATELIMPRGRKRIPFRPHYSGMIADCTLRLPDRFQPAGDLEISVTATVTVSTDERSDRHTISGVLERSRWSGYWLIFEAFTPHAWIHNSG